MQDIVQTKTNIVPAWQLSKGKRENESILTEVDLHMEHSKSVPVFPLTSLDFRSHVSICTCVHTYAQKFLPPMSTDTHILLRCKSWTDTICAQQCT